MPTHGAQESVGGHLRFSSWNTKSQGLTSALLWDSVFRPGLTGAVDSASFVTRSCLQSNLRLIFGTVCPSAVGDEFLNTVLWGTPSFLNVP